MPRKLNAQQLANILAERAWPTLLASGAKPNACLLATRMAVEAGRLHNITIKPVPVTVMIANPVGTTYWRATRKSPFRPEDPATKQRLDDEGLWTLGVPYIPGQPGHVIAHIPSLQLYLDLTPKQFDRPDHDLTLPPAIVFSRRTADVLVKHHPITLDTGGPHGALVVYQHEPRMKAGFTRNSDWNRASYARKLARTLLTA